MGQRLLALPLLAVVLAAAPAAAQEEADWEARLTQASGEVTVYTAQAPEGLPAEEDMPLEAGDRVSTGKNGSAEVALEQGAHLLVLRANSDFTLASVSRVSTEFKLSLGSLLARIQKLAAGYSMRVRTPAAVAAVRGTEFAVEVAADNAEETYVAVFDEGQVEVSGETGKAERLISNQETKVARGRPPLPAYGLGRLLRHRAQVRGFSRRGVLVRKGWKQLAPEERMAARRQALERMRRKRLEMQEKIQQKRRQGPSEEQRKRLEEHRKKMEERRQKIKQRIKRP